MTLHRPANVDEADQLSVMIDKIIEQSEYFPIFPIHIRTRNVFDQLGIDLKNVQLGELLGFLEFNSLVNNSGGVITDSACITEETIVMGIPCMTLRNNTERPDTVSLGTNEFIGIDPLNLQPYLKKLIRGDWKKKGIPEKWDVKAAEPIINPLVYL